jgi:hypothetical protein
MRASLSIALLAAVFATSLHGQIAVKDEKVVEIAPQVALTNLKSGYDDSLYFRAAAGTTIVHIGANGKVVGQFQFDAIPGLSGAQLVDYAPELGGGIYEAVVVPSKPRGLGSHYLLHFNSNGQLASKDLNEYGFYIRSLATLGTDSLLMTGADRKTSKLVAAILTTDGRLVTYLDLQDDLNAKAMERTFHCDYCGDSQLAARDALRSELSNVSAASFDGGAFLYRHQADGPIYVVREGGAVQTVRLIPPTGGKLESVRVTSDSVAAAYRIEQPGNSVHKQIIVVDRNGKKSAEITPNDSDYLISYSREQLIFLRLSSGLQLVFAQPGY